MVEGTLIYVPGFVLVVIALSFLGRLFVIVAKPEEEWQEQYNSETFQE